MSYEHAFKSFKRDLSKIIEYFEITGIEDEIELETLKKVYTFLEESEGLVSNSSQELKQKKGGNIMEKNEKFEYKGYAIEEILEKFQIEYNYLNANQTIEKFLTENFRNEEVVSEVRCFIEKIIEVEYEESEYKKVWKTLLEIEDDDIFMQFVIKLFPMMWT